MIAIFHLTSPLSHSAFGADAGNALPLRRMSIVSLPEYPTVPVISGNAIRNGGIRRSLMRELFTVLDIGPQSTPRWDEIYAALANGGTIRAAEKRLEPERIRSVREAIPALSVLGSALYTWLLAGHCSIGIGWPVCTETVAAGLVRVPQNGAHVPSSADIEGEYTESRLPDDERQNIGITGVGPMPTTVEVFWTGVTIESRVTFAKHATSVERGAIAHGLTLLTSLGGKSAHGLGTFRLEMIDADPDPYRAWLDDPAARNAARESILSLPDWW